MLPGSNLRSHSGSAASLAAAVVVGVALTLSGMVQAEEAVAPTSADPLVQFIDAQIRTGWEENEITPSPRADDEEWLRRVYLDLAGHIPSADDLDQFLAEEDGPRQSKRSKVIDKLLDSNDYVRNFTEVWANLLIGRNTPDRTSRAGMRKFLRESFARSRPWNEIVYDLTTAEGHYEENGAVNFLLGQLQLNQNSEDYHVEATARLTRLFLGMQVQCTQCHNHPFNEWKQNQFWEFNSFLRQARRIDHDKFNPQSGQREDDYSELVWMDFQGPVYYEQRDGLVQVAYPTYLGTEVDPGMDTNRRLELAKLMCHTDTEQTLAKAYVNRMWGHFFGYGFTRPVDDMGPHNPASHPELLDRLADEFVKSGYDMKQLARWICNSEAYGLTSQFNESNEIDNPAAGEVPLFSHLYVKTMQVEQLYDSLIIATNAHKSGSGSYEEAERQREMWMNEFLVIFGGNDEDEPTLFSGSIPQALLMMNGPLVQQAISAEKGSYLNTILNDGKYRSDPLRVQALYMSALGRKPDRAELNQVNKLMARSRDKLAAFQDLYWALLNSNEFIVNH